MANNDLKQRFVAAAMALGANKDIETAKEFAVKYRQNPERYDNAAQGVMYTRDVYGKASYGFTPEQYRSANNQFQYYKTRTEQGYEPIKIANLDWNPTQYDDITNEALAGWYKSNKSLPSAYQAAEFSGYLAQYKQEREAADIKDMYRLAGYNKAGSSRLKFNDAWKEYDFDYDATDADDIRRKQIGMPPKAFLNLYTTDGDLADEDTRRFEAGELPVALDPVFQRPTPMPRATHGVSFDPRGVQQAQASAAFTGGQGVQQPAQAAQSRATLSVDDLKAEAQTEIDRMLTEREQKIAENEALRDRTGRGESEFTGYRDIEFADPTDSVQGLILNAPVSQENIAKGAQSRSNKYNRQLQLYINTVGSADAAADTLSFDPQTVGVSMITDAEADIINAYYGAGDTKAGDAVYDYYTEKHAREYAEQEAADFAESASGASKVMAAVGSFMPSTQYAAQTAGNALASAVTGNTEPARESAATLAMRRAGAGEASLLENTRGVGRWAAQVGLGTAKMLPMLATGVAAPALMGASAGGQAALDAKDSGATAGQQFFQGLAQGVAEGLFEKWSLGALKAFKPVKAAGVKGVLRELAKLGFVNATEEVFTDVSNMLTDAVIMEAFGDGKSESEIRQLYEARINNGQPVDDARWGVVGDIGVKLLNTAAVGAGMGVLLGGGKVAGEAASGIGTRAEQGAAAQEPPAPRQSVTDAPQAIAGLGLADTPAQQQNAVQGQETANTQYAQQDAQRQEVAQMRSQAEAVIETLPAEQQDTAREVLTQWQNENNAARANPNVVMLESRDSIDTVTDSRMQKVDRLGKVLGVNVQWAESINRPNGQTAEAIYDTATNTITIAVEADAPYQRLFGHEFTHHLEQSDGYTAMRDFVVQQIQQRGDYDAAIQLLSDTYQTNDTAILERELVADYAKNVLFADEATVRYFVRSQSGLGGRILNWITDTLAKLGGQNGEAAAMLRRARDLWAAAMQGERGANVDATQGLAQTEQGIPAPTNEQQPQAQSDRRVAFSESGALAEGSQYSLRSDPLDAMLAEYGVKRAKVLTRLTEETPPLRERATNLRNVAIRRMVDSGNEIARIGRIAKDDALYQDYDWVRRSRSIAENMIAEAQFDINGNRVGDSLRQIFEPAARRGDDYLRAFYEYLYDVHNIDRMTLDERGYGKNKPVFSESDTAEISRKRADRALQAHPEFKDMAEAVYAYNQNLMQWRVDSGIVSEENAQQMQEMYPHYVPTYRVLPKKGGIRTRGGEVATDPGIRSAKGSNLDLVPIDVSMARQTLQTVAAARFNMFGLRLLENAKKHARVLGEYVGITKQDSDADTLQEVADAVLETDPAQTDAQEREQARSGRRKTLPNTFVIYEDGTPTQIRVNEAVAEGLVALEQKSYDQLQSLAVKGVRLFKALITNYSPLFTVRNILRDVQDATLYSDNMPQFARNLMTAARELAANTEDAQLYRAMGGYATSIFTHTDGVVPDTSKLHDVLAYLPRRIEALNILTEQATRFAEFKAVLNKEGRTPDGIRKALYASAEVTVNFSRSGNWGRALNATFVPFFNPSVQGASKMFRAFGGQNGWNLAKRTAIRAALFGIAPAVLNHMLLGDDEDYAILPDRVKWGSWVFKVAKNKFLIIPKGRVLSVIGGGAQSVYDMVTGKDVKWADFGEFAVSQAGPVDPLTSHVLAPALAMKTNQTWYGSPIETAAMQNLPAPQRYDEKTDAISKWLGKALNASPKKINYLLDAYTGVLGDVALPILSPYAERNGFVKAFTVDTVLSSKIPGEFYEALQGLTEESNTEGAGQHTAYVLSYMNRQARQVSDINKEIRAIQNSTDIKSAAKLEMVRGLRAVANGIMAESLRALQTYSEIAIAHNPDVAPGESGGARYVAEINYDAFGAEHALRVYFGADTFNSRVVKARDLGLSYDQYYKAYFSIKDIKDKYANVYTQDEYGNNDELSEDNNAARKAEVMKYITRTFQSAKEREIVTTMIAGYASGSTSGAPTRGGTEDKPKRGKIQ